MQRATVIRAALVAAGLAAATTLLLRARRDGAPEKSPSSPVSELSSTGTARDTAPAEPQPPAAHVRIGFVGDVLLHMPLQQQARAQAHSGGFASLWRPLLPWMRSVDLLYANLEGPVSHSTPHGSYPLFNYDFSLPGDLVSSHIGVVSTANNHALDRGSRGVDETIQNLTAAGLPFTGTHASTALDEPWHVVTNVQGLRLAWVACTFSTNGLPDRKGQVLDCHRQREELLSLIRVLAGDRSLDGVIVTPHWGVENVERPLPGDRALAHAMLQAGALTVVAAHPHVLQPWEMVPVGSERRFVLYSLGNFVNGNARLTWRTSTLLMLDFERPAGGRLNVVGVHALPLLLTGGGLSRQLVPAGSVRSADGLAALALHRKLLGTAVELPPTFDALAEAVRGPGGLTEAREPPPSPAGPPALGPLTTVVSAGP